MSLFPLANRQELLGPPVRPRPSVALRPIHFVTAPADGFMKEIQEESGGGAAVGGGAKCSSLAFSNMPLPLSFLSPRVLTSGKLLTPIFHPLDPRLSSAPRLLSGGNGHSRISSAAVPVLLQVSSFSVNLRNNFTYDNVSGEEEGGREGLSSSSLLALWRNNLRSDSCDSVQFVPAPHSF